MLYEAWAEYASTNGMHLTNSNLFWEVGKAFLRGKIVSYMSQFKRHSLKQFQQTSDTLRLAHEALTQNRTLATIKAWQLAKCSFYLWAEQKEAAKTSYSTVHVHIFGNKVGKLLAKLCAGPRWPMYISALKNAAGSIVTSPMEISKILASDYTSLYSEDPIDQKQWRLC